MDEASMSAAQAAQAAANQAKVLAHEAKLRADEAEAKMVPPLRHLSATDRSRLGLQVATRLALIPTVVVPVTILLWRAVFVG